MSTSIFDKHYLSVLGVKMLQGCLLSVTETREERRVIIINQHFTSQLSAVDNSGKLLQSGWANHSRETLYQSWCMCRWAITRHNGATTRLFAVDFHRFAR